MVQVRVNGSFLLSGLISFGGLRPTAGVDFVTYPMEIINPEF
jgi:hypothetical protein